MRAKEDKPKLTLLDEIRAEARSPRPTCKLSEFLTTLSAEERRAALEATLDHSIPGTAVLRWLQKRGYRHSVKTITRHRHESCPDCQSTP